MTMIEWNIHYVRGDIEDGTEEFFIVLPSFLKVLWWFLRTARRCSQIVIYTTQKRGAQCEPLEIDQGASGCCSG